jgi:UDP-glucose 4-epimerase
MHALVTGGAGFIGSHLVEELLRRGDTVRVLDNFSTGTRKNVELFQGNIELMEGDLRNVDTVNAAVNGVDQIFHLAAFVSVPRSMEDPDTCFAVNVGGTVSLLEAARRAGVRKVVLSSSTAVYGNTDFFPTTEETPLLPLSPYAVSKQVNEIYARMYTKVMGLPVTSLRYYNVYGPRQRSDSDYAAVIPIFISQMAAGKPVTIFGDGKQTRDFIFVKDVVHANLMAADSDIAGESFNICAGQETSLIDLLEELSEIFPHPPQVHFNGPRSGDIYRSVGSPDKAAATLGFRTEVSLAKGLAQTVDWWIKK